MKVKLIGLGKVGRGMALNLLEHHHEVLGYDNNEIARINASNLNISIVDNLYDLLKRKENEGFIIWLFIPNQSVDIVIEQLMPHLSKKDIIIDGGNSNFNVSIKRYHTLKNKGINFIDLGISGGIQGAREGACLMAGGDKEIVKKLEPMFMDVSQINGYKYVGKPGAGHFIKMVLNGIEYGMMQAIGEGFDLLKASPFELNYKDIAHVWSHGSLIESTLMKYVHQAFSYDPNLEQIQGKIDDGGEGMWMIEEALKYKVALPVITQALYARYKSKDESLFGEKVVAAIRKEFGGHAVYKK